MIKENIKEQWILFRCDNCEYEQMDTDKGFAQIENQHQDFVLNKFPRVKEVMLCLSCYSDLTFCFNVDKLESESQIGESEE
jgi:hypothetical protein